jgi:hypothetical protein
MFLTLLSPQAAPDITSIDTSDVLSRRTNSYRQFTSAEEEAIAAQLIKQRNKKKRNYDLVKTAIDWKKLFADRINAAATVEELNAIKTPELRSELDQLNIAVINEIEQIKEARRIALNIAKQEAELKLIELEAQAKDAEAVIYVRATKRQQELEAAKQIQIQVLARYEMAMNQALDIERKARVEAEEADRKAKEFIKKREQRIKRLKSLMWLAGLDI